MRPGVLLSLRPVLLGGFAAALALLLAELSAPQRRLVLEAQSVTGAAGAESKDNLDLPYDAAGVGEEDGEAPEVLAFYGHSYEASAVVFALDESGSMENQGRWGLQTREVTRSIHELSAKADFGVVYYGSRVTAFREDPVAATDGAKGGGVGFVQAHKPGGDTCVGEGVVKALEIVQKSSHKHKAVIVTSDGRPDNCATGNSATPAEINALLQRTANANPGGAIRVHTVFVGQAGDANAIRFMRRLAQLHGGTFRLVSS